MKRDLVERPTFPTYTIYVDLKFKLSDLEVVLANAFTKLPDFQSLNIFSQLHIITLILVICFIGSKQIGDPR
jgi:hypothetical protein